MTATRFDWQQHLASIYAASMDTVSGDSLVHTVYAYMIGDPKGLSPFVTVSAGGTDFLDDPAVYGAQRDTFNIDVLVFVLYSQKLNNYTNVNAEERLAEISQRIRDLNTVNGSADNRWSRLDYREASRITTANIGGNTYHIESIRLRLSR